MENSLSVAQSFMCIFFSGVGCAVKYVIKCSLFTRKWHVMESNVAKWNLNGKIQLKHVKNSLISIKCKDWVCSDWTLDVVFIRNGM